MSFLARLVRLKVRLAAVGIATVIALAGALAAGALRAGAAAQPLSAGCTAANGPTFDGAYDSRGFSRTFSKGEQLTLTAASASALKFVLTVSGLDVATVDIPGTLVYTFPTSARFNVAWTALPAGPATWKVTCTAPVAFRSLSASATTRGVLVRWRTTSEVGLTGFNVYRQSKGRRVRVNARVIAARGAGVYSFLDARAPRGTPLRYWIQLVNTDGSRGWYGPARVARR